MKNRNNFISSLEYFKNIWKLNTTNNFNIFIVERAETPVGAGGFFVDKEHQIIYWNYLGYDYEYPQLLNRYNIFYYLGWKQIEWAEENNFQYLDFGSTPADEKTANHSLKNDLGAVFNQDYILYTYLDRNSFILREIMINHGKKVGKLLPKQLYSEIYQRLG